MRDFFKGWRRKVGVALLGLACVLTIAWIRSRVVSDRLLIRRYGHVAEYLVSQESGFGWSKEISWNLIGADVLTDAPYQEWFGFKYGMKLFPEAWIAKVSVRIVPYWSLTIPLTLFSAYLLLWPQCKTIQRPTNSNLNSN